MASLYETDFYAWTQHQAALLRAEEFSEVDWNHLIEEIETLGRSERNEIKSRLVVLIMHLLNWQYQPELQSRSWVATITVQRDDLAALLADNPSLQAQLAVFVDEVYSRAIKRSVQETGLRAATFPEVCPFSAEEIMDEDFWPEDQ